MKLSRSVSCGCCFCCYCRSWLTMLLMVSSVIHASPEMSTTKTFTSLNNYYQAMTEFAKLNAKLSNTTTTNTEAAQSMEAMSIVRTDTNEHIYRTLQSYGTTTAQTINASTQTHSTTTTTTPTSSPDQLVSQRSGIYSKTKQMLEHVNTLHRSTTRGTTSASNGDNYDADRNVVIPTIVDTGDAGISIETLDNTEGQRMTQITTLDGHNSIRYPSTDLRIETKQQQQTNETLEQTTKRDTNNEPSLRDIHDDDDDDDDKTTSKHQQYNRGKVQKTKVTTQTPKAWWSSSKSRQYMTTATLSSTRSHNVKATHNSKTTKSLYNIEQDDDVSDISQDTNNVNKTILNYSNTHNTLPSMAATWTHLPEDQDMDLVSEELSQLSRPRYTRQAEDGEIDKCRTFVEGDPDKMELYSPDYPNDYPKNMNCTKVITAPKGQIIRLDFRNYFNIEKKEDCKFDFLEIRDGQYGFSNLIGKYCGTDFPPEITSKERYLWLFFHSDESIEYNGFTAVYEFIDRNRDAPSTDLNCTIEKNGYEGFINSTDVYPEIRAIVVQNKIALDCMWRIQVEEKWKIQVKFIEFRLTKPNDCQANFLDIFPEQTVMPARVKNFCGSAGEGITSESNILHMRFFAEQSAINSTFSILYTAFRDRGSGACNEGEYDCEDATCIAADLKCNGRDNCKFRWDEESCKTDDEGQSEHMVIIITVFGLILGGMVITFLVNCVRKIMHDQKIIREHIRQSKESKLDEMGRSSKTRSRDNISIVSPRQKHSQTSLQILDDVSNRYYREMELQAKGDYKEKDPNFVRRHDMIVQTSLCSTDNSSTTTADHPPTASQTGACDMGCQTRESLFGAASLLRNKSKTPSMTGSHRTVEGVPPPPRFSTFGYDAAQIVAAPPPPSAAATTLSRRNMHLPQESFESEHPTIQTHMTIIPPQQPQQQQHRHLHHRPSQEVCHHHHQHQQMQKQTLPRHHPHQHYQDQAQQPTHHHGGGGGGTMPAPGTTIVTAISTGSNAARTRDSNAITATTGNPASGAGGPKGKHNKTDESKIFIDIRNSAPDVIIMTSH